MSPHEKYLRVLASLAPAGAVGMSLLLGSATPSEANYQPIDVRSPGPVSGRLAAIRAAISAIGARETVADEPAVRLAWGNVMGNHRWGNSLQQRFIDRWGNYWENGLHR
jgi:hypothetical protein